MLDGIGIPEALGLGTSAELFTVQSSLPACDFGRGESVFEAGKNYTGSSPTIPESALLRPYLDVLADEADQVAEAIIVPLGKAVETALRWLIDAGRVDEARCLFGFPHPSGANAHRSANTRRIEIGCQTRLLAGSLSSCRDRPLPLAMCHLRSSTRIPYSPRAT